MPLDEGLFEQEVGPRRLTRGKAADMGLARRPFFCPSMRRLPGCARACARPRARSSRRTTVSLRGVCTRECTGIEVGPIVDISEQALLGRDVAPRRAEEGGAGGQDAGGGGEASRKRPRENDEDGGKADAKEKDAEDGAPSKKARSEGEADGKAPEPA